MRYDGRPRPGTTHPRELPTDAPPVLLLIAFQHYQEPTVLSQCCRSSRSIKAMDRNQFDFRLVTDRESMGWTGKQTTRKLTGKADASVKNTIQDIR